MDYTKSGLPVDIINFSFDSYAYIVERCLGGYGANVTTYNSRLPEESTEHGHNYPTLRFYIIICESANLLCSIFDGLEKISPYFESDCLIISPTAGDEIVEFCVKNNVNHLHQEIRKQQILHTVGLSNKKYCKFVRDRQKELYLTDKEDNNVAKMDTMAG